MPVNSFLLATAIPLWGGIALSFLLELLLQPAPNPIWKRPLASTAIHIGVSILFFCVLLAILRRPYFVALIQVAFILLLVLVNNAKLYSLKEPFVFQDFDYFSDAIKHPRLYLPFLGVLPAIAGVSGFVLAIATGLMLERSIDVSVSPHDFMNGWVGLFLLAVALLWWGSLRRIEISLDPERDIVAQGVLGFLWRYGMEELRPTQKPQGRIPEAPAANSSVRPDLVVVQSESFFDIRKLFSGIRSDVLANFDALKASAVCHGELEVPAWGANTVRSEFAFLSGLEQPALGIHRFNPYRRLAQQGVQTLALYLQALGYRTVCVHPYPASFYSRNKIYPLLGFDEFVDIKSFERAERFGPYISDAALAQKACEILKQEQGNDRPVFVFVITMENHGPLHLEQIQPGDIERLYTDAPPKDCEDMTIYLRHIANADRMYRTLREELEQSAKPGWLCIYGDHVPIMPKVYRTLGEPAGPTDYLVWHNREEGKSLRRNMKIEELGHFLLGRMELLAQ